MVAAMGLRGEAAYWARDYTQAAASYNGFLSAYPNYPQAPMASLALGWAEVQGGKPEAARQRWTRYAQQAQADPRAPDGLVSSAQRAGPAGAASGGGGGLALTGPAPGCPRRGAPGHRQARRRGARLPGRARPR